MRKLVILLALLLPGTVWAEAVGCYIQADNPFQCSNHVINCTGNFAQDTFNLGGPIADVCQNFTVALDGFQQAIDGWTQCNSDSAFYVSNWKACGDTNKQIKGAIGYWEGLTHYYEGLTARLRAKCGKKCRNL